MKQTEREIQRESVKALRRLGFVVWVTSTNRASRNTVGTPDVFVGIGKGMAVCLEFKGPDTKKSDIQDRQEIGGLVFTVRSVEQALSCAGIKKLIYT